MRFDKLATSAVQPLPTRLVLTYQAAPAAPASLDAESGSAPMISGLVFPAAHVDLDVLFLGTRWAAEVNTSRRSDHLAKFGVTWGPLAAAAKATPVGQGAWGPVTSGPAALLGWGVASQLRVGWRAQADLGLLLGASAAAAARLHTGGSEAAAGTPAQATWGDGVRRAATPSTPTPSTLDLPSPSPAHQWRPLTMPQRSAPFPATAGGYLALRTDVGGICAACVLQRASTFPPILRFMAFLDQRTSFTPGQFQAWGSRLTAFRAIAATGGWFSGGGACTGASVWRCVVGTTTECPSWCVSSTVIPS